MARFQNGWIKLWRKAVEGDLAENPILWALWNWLLYTATWKATSIIWKCARRDIPAGTVVLGISEIAERWECSQSTVKKWLAYLQSSDRISLETCSRGTLVTILNWDAYQSPYAERREPSENEVGTKCEQGENQVGLIEEGKKERKKERKKREAVVLPALAQIWNNHRGQLPGVIGCGGVRLAHAKARWEENPSTEYWAEIVIRIARSDFCNGKGSTGWRADFDFLIKPDSQHKVLEGKYDGRGDAPGGYVDPEILKIRKQLEAEDANEST